jgi:hypothetical protein
VLSLITVPVEFREGIAALLQVVEQWAAEG